jgi:mitochondrial fission protein ELM1
MAVSRPEERALPECLRLEVRPGETPCAKPPVRIFLGSQPAQQRAERVFVWSIERVRDPSRVYEIHLMKGLAGFDRRRWTTGFTNYRFAIPHFASADGRAIYNDVDQIYLADPAELFDTDPSPHGYRAVAPDDLSVMVMDCARMAEIWPLEAARREPKGVLQERAAESPGLYGELSPAWNARDGEYAPGVSKLLHFTNLHTQPWRPFPERFAYQPHPQEELWHELERSADAAGFELFTRQRPSQLYRAAGGEPPLERVPVEDLPWVLRARFESGEQPLRLSLRCDPPRGVARGPDGLHEPVRSAAWWSERIEAAAARHPGVRWEAELATPGAPTLQRRGGPREDGAPPRVWVLADDRAGNTTQSVGLAEALGWPYELKRLVPGPFARLHNRVLGASRAGIDPRRSDPLAPPWPDLVIAAGRRTAPVALWIREASGGHTRLVQLGRKGGDRAELFDLVAAPAFCRLPPHPRRVELHAPLHRVRPAALAAARERWRERLAQCPAPRIALLVGGTSGQYRLDRRAASELGAAVARLARERGGSVLASTSRRTGKAASEALRAALADVPGFFYAAGDAGENPYLGLLAWADELVVTADSESILAEAASLGKPLAIYGLPERASFRALRVPRDAVAARARAQPAGPRGTGRPQQGLELWCARALERGWLRPTRDLGLLHEELIRCGVASRFGEPPPQVTGAPLREAEGVARRVRALLGIPGAPGL